MASWGMGGRYLQGVLLLAGVAGCDQVFGLHQLPVGGDAGDRPTACWNAALQGDEDGDQVADGCDDCPADVNPGQEDGDRDGVGDACDPRPGRMDQIVFFDGFAAPTLGAAWTPLTISGAPTWTIDNGAVHQTAGSGVLELATPTVAGAVVEVWYSTASTTAITGAWVRIATPGSPSAAHVECWTGSGGLHAATTSDPNNNGFALFTQVGRLRLLAFDVGACELTAGGPIIAASLQRPLAEGSGTIGLYAYNSVAEFASVTVFAPR
jgi:hypothetical protein